MKHVPVPFDHLRKMDAETRKIIDVMKGCAARCDVIRQSYKDNGNYGCAAMTTELEILRQASKKKTAPHRWELEKAYTSFCDALDAAILPDGHMIDSGDAALMQSGLIRTPSELRALQRRHSDNRAMLRLIEDYASRKKWEGFENYNYDDAHYLRAFAEDRVKMARNLADGYEGDALDYSALFFTKHTDAEADYRSWAAENDIQLS